MFLFVFFCILEADSARDNNPGQILWEELDFFFLSIQAINHRKPLQLVLKHFNTNNLS